jgi:hypothetical protein
MFNPESGPRPEEEPIPDPQAEIIDTIPEKAEKTEIEKQIEAEETKLSENTQKLESNLAEVETLEQQEPEGGWGSKVKKCLKATRDFVEDNFLPEIAGALGGAAFGGTELGSIERLGAMAMGAAIAVGAKYALKFGKNLIKTEKHG